MLVCQVTVYEGFTRTDPTIKAFWNVVHGFTLEMKRQFLQFVTGCAKVCAPSVVGVGW